MFPFTAGKMVSYESIRSYLIEKNVPQIFESIMTGLMYHRPEDQLMYMEQCVAMIKQYGPENLSWNTFIECSFPPKRPLPSCSRQEDRKSTSPSRNQYSSPPLNSRTTLPPIPSLEEKDDKGKHAKNVIAGDKKTNALVRENLVIPDCPIILITGVPSSGILDVEQKITHIAGGYVCISSNVLAKDIHDCRNYNEYLEIPSGCMVEDLMKMMEKYKDASALIILGFPRNSNDFHDFVEMVCDVDAVIMLDYKESDYREKSNGHNQQSIDEQVQYFKKHTLPAIETIEEMGVLNLIDVADDDETLVMEAIIQALSTIVKNYTKGKRNLARMKKNSQKQLPIMSAQSKPIERKDIDTRAIKESKLPLIFVLGGPGSGKGTQCEKIVAKYGFTHLSSGDLLRDEVKSGSSRGKQLNDAMEKGELVPMEVVLDLIKEKMMNALPASKGYLLDGYPREVVQGTTFEKEVCDCTVVLYFEVSDETMTSRLLQRGQTSGRVDDNRDTIVKRLNTFHQITTPVIDHYSSKVNQISAENDPDSVFVKVIKVIDGLTL